jgi:putative endonuclease
MIGFAALSPWSDDSSVSSMQEHNYSVYMVASTSRALYIGMTNNLRRRIFGHKNDLIEGFTRQYKCHRLVYYESFDDVNKAIDRENQSKRWNRTKKDRLIARRNPTWEDLAAEWYVRHQFEPERKQSA